MKLSKTRTTTEHCFGDLKNVWRRLLYNKSSPQKAVAIVSACCMLDNFLIINGEKNPQSQSRRDESHQLDLDEFADDWFSTLKSEKKRNELIVLLSNT